MGSLHPIQGYCQVSVLPMFFQSQFYSLVWWSKSVIEGDMLNISTSCSHGGDHSGIEPGPPTYKPCLLTTTALQLTLWGIKLSCSLKAQSPVRIVWSSVSLRPVPNMCKDESPLVSPTNGLFKTISLLNLSYWFEALSPRRPVQWMWRVSSPVLPTNGHFKSISKVYLYKLPELDSTLLVYIIYWHKVMRFIHFIEIFPLESCHFIYMIV